MPRDTAAPDPKNDRESDLQLPRVIDPSTSRIENASDLALGQWYWLKWKAFDKEEGEDDDGDEDDDEEPELLCCVTHIGSNYVLLEYPPQETRWTGRTWRVHFGRFYRLCRPEPEALRILQGRVLEWQEETRSLMQKVQETCMRLGVSSHQVLGMIEDGPGEDGTYALATLSSRTDVEGYKTSLIKAKETELPGLFKKIEHANAEMVRWMAAQTLPMRAQTGDLRAILKVVDGRIFNVELYAGLLEKVIHFAEGEPAPIGAKLHVLQRRHYMDEECLLAYEHGGMEFKNLGAFDEWLAKPVNRDRLMPYPRCVLAFRVRRHIKYRGGLDLDMFVKLQLENSDKSTFLYIRNGENLYCLQTDLDFGPKLFRDRSIFTSGQPLWAKVTHDKVEDFITNHDYEVRHERLKEAQKADRIRRKQHNAWKKAHPGENPWNSPHNHEAHELWVAKRDCEGWQPFDSSSVWYDDMREYVQEQIEQYNRIALVIQGLFDRSEILHPHTPVQLWTPEGFADAVELVQDGERVLYDGPPPDFEAYRRRLNESIAAGTVTIGQDDYCARREGDKENRRRDNDWRDKGSYRPSHHRPYGNPGPGVLARIAKWQKRARRATYEWTRERQHATWEHSRRKPIDVKLVVPEDKLLNADAYTPGDYLQFFRDPRTRADYLQWAPLLLLAEEYHAGHRRVGPSGQQEPWRTPNGEYPPELLERLAETLDGTINSVISGMEDIGVEVPVEDVAVIVKALRAEGTDKCQKCGRWVSTESRRTVFFPWSPAEETCRICDPRPEDDEEEDEEEPDEGE